jgi:hypothetical protein
MTTASLDNCKELYELSGWTNTFLYHAKSTYESDGIELSLFKGDGSDVTEDGYFEKLYGVWSYGDIELGNYEWTIPAYDAGYLLRKLPISTDGGKWRFVLQKDHHNGKGTDWWFASYVHINSMAQFQPIAEQKALHICEADTPEDALCLLAIELFKTGVIK